jgi:hypothetical protein
MSTMSFVQVMEGDKEAYLEEATKALKRQRKTIEDLDKEKRDLNRSLKNTRSKMNHRKDGENAAKLARLAEEQVRLRSMMKQVTLLSFDSFRSLKLNLST